ncbi:outer membrane protein beta-barrel domain protein [Kordia sp. SMS9]|uniref:porin family protein n=1 Tax=Kordia sp. SMS9 TaxID=2282170 RepID=UPI000E0E00C7|nr:porin family protein [Kordia sp. SMS9]AXG72008.1 outer membrane protein beta-barrel domain protein [Kordia sp. SMS9]
MKKIILLSFLLGSFMAFSQETEKVEEEMDESTYVSGDTETRYGFKAGINLSNYSGTNLEDIQEGLNDSRIGFVAGFFLDMHVAGKLRFQPELLYSSQGAKEEALRADYLQVPLMLKYELTNFLNIQVGPQIGVKIHEFEDSFKNFDFGVNGGIGVTILENVAIEARYNLGLADMFDEDRAPNFEGKNAVIQIGLTYRL